MELPLSEASKTLFLDRWYIKTRQMMGMFLLPIEYFLDCLRFMFHCRLSPFISSPEKDSYDLIFFAHTIEKGLSLPNPRPFFGKNNVARVVHLLRVCDKDKTNPAAIQMGLGALVEYVQYHEARGNRNPYIDEVDANCRALIGKFKQDGIGGTRDVSDTLALLQSKSLCYSGFIESRYSCRSYTKDAVHIDDVEDAVRIAQSAPSQCNRQSSRIYHYSSPGKIRELLALQGGSRGFAEDVPCLLVVTNELSAWTGKSERNQCYVDGALFAMCLLLAFHSKCIGACALNFAKTNRDERHFLRLAGISKDERVIMLIAVGHQDPSKTKAARSVRVPLERILRKM